MGSLLEVKVSAPGKVILHGEHSVMFGHMAVAGSLGLRTSITIKEVNSSSELNVRIRSPSVGLEQTISTKAILENLFSSSKYSQSWKEPQKIDHENHLRRIENFVKNNVPAFEDLQSVQKNSIYGFLYLLSGIFGDTNLLDRSLEIAIESGLKVGAGTGSSASFAVCSAGALIQLLGLKSGTRNKESFSFEDKQLISAWAYNCERIMHGTPSGIDNATCTFGSLVSFRKGEEPRLLDLKMNLRLLLVDTRVSRETKTLANKVASLRQRNLDVVDSVMAACGHLTETAIDILEKLSSGNIENTEAEYEHLAELWSMNHRLLAALGASHAALDRIHAHAARRALGAKLTGAGGGGYAIVLIPPASAASTVGALTAELEGRGYGVTDTRLGGAGVTVDS